MTAFVQNLLQQMQTRFQTMSDSIITKNILFYHFVSQIYVHDITKQMGVEGTPPPPSKSGDEPKTPADST
ncbi:BnaC08g10440D [Brassica napus]|uniref:BnaC08g10440D protein n=2 Tax=Brassica TaxID=3705 RepID=A0A078ILN6_BRANA|nr:BnaC08g10440D [Brassica napus]